MQLENYPHQHHDCSLKELSGHCSHGTHSPSLTCANLLCSFEARIRLLILCFFHKCVNQSKVSAKQKQSFCPFLAHFSLITHSHYSFQLGKRKAHCVSNRCGNKIIRPWWLSLARCIMSSFDCLMKDLEHFPLCHILVVEASVNIKCFIHTCTASLTVCLSSSEQLFESSFCFHLNKLQLNCKTVSAIVAFYQAFFFFPSKY